ncbi:hypothetical protein NUM_72490 [Actinocatenispora comari]|uniref:Uncharacterized protein n=1 Tax=Actinocatenispora comari TaxID=2807577 RepID=A0A8J4AK13_9ACTN|nr:hypothetical protein NUM_72490 [Actinocatenispora comari]
MTRPGPARPRPAQPGARGTTNPRVGIVVGVVVVLGLIGLCSAGIVSSVSSDDGGTDNGLLLASDADALATDLAKATAAQGICYGWDLSVDNAGTPNHGVGSNEGAGKAVDESGCQRWVVFDVDVTWTPESSEAADSETAVLRSSGDLGELPSIDELTDVGVTDKTLTDDPAGSTIAVLEALPLMLSERGAADPLPAATDEPTSTVRVPPEAGSDRWRANKAFAIAAIVLLLAAGGLVVWGVRRRRDAGRTPPPPSGPRAAYGGGARPPYRPAGAPPSRPSGPRPVPPRSGPPSGPPPRPGPPGAPPPRRPAGPPPAGRPPQTPPPAGRPPQAPPPAGWPPLAPPPAGPPPAPPLPDGPPSVPPAPDGPPPVPPRAGPPGPGSVPADPWSGVQPAGPQPPRPLPPQPPQ